ncbi:MAG: SAM-dependent methyltransferase TehB [Alcaligenaceae bacterium]|nr:SAM-dependent methyltransferase TehB [Alcaligenaceae bacterium]
MQKLKCYKTMPIWTYETLPEGFRKRHNTKAGTWAKLNILSGKLQFDELNENDEVLNSYIFDSNTEVPFVAPQLWHKVTPLTEDLTCQLSFYHEVGDYYKNKYQLSKTHSEAYELIKHIQEGELLDLGCGSGRNALFFAEHGFKVTAFDRNPNAVNNLKNIAIQEHLKINAFVHDANLAQIQGSFDAIFSSVVLMFLDSQRIPDIIRNMQESTNPNGYNLIVCAMDSDDYPMSRYQLPFQFGFKTGELKAYYKDWELVKYNEDIGHLHRTDEHGNRIALRFATMIARKKSSNRQH